MPRRWATPSISASRPSSSCSPTTAVGTPAPASLDDNLDKPCYDLRGLLHNYPVVDEIVSAMNELGWDVYSFDHEDGNGQFETDFTYTDAVSMSDRFVFFRMMVGEIARKHGLFASWMPKPFADRTGSGAHYNMSLADDDGANLFEATRRSARLRPVHAGLPVHRRRAAARAGDLRGHRADGQQLQATWSSRAACPG